MIFRGIANSGAKKLFVLDCVCVVVHGAEISKIAFHLSFNRTQSQAKPKIPQIVDTHTHTTTTTTENYTKQSEMIIANLHY